MAVLSDAGVPRWALNWLAAFDRFTPARVVGLQRRRRAQLVVAVSAVAAIGGATIAFAAPWVGFTWEFVVILWAVAVGAAMVPLLLRSTAAVGISANVLVGIWLIAALTGIYYRGGVDAPPTVCIALVPLLASLLAGARSGLFWLLISVAAVVLAAFAAELGLEMRDRAAPEYLTAQALAITLLVVALVLMLALAYEAMREAAQATVDEALGQRLAAENEAQVLRADRLAALGQLSASLAHEINNPLMYVMGNVEFLLDAEGLEPVRREAARDAYEGAERIAAIVRDLKAYASNEDEEDGPVDLVVVAQSTLRLVRGHVRRRAELSLELEPCAQVRGNWGRLGQVLINLVVNSAHAIEPGAPTSNEIKVSTGTDERGRSFLEVADTGCGIPADELHRVTEPFYTTKPEGVGTGLGLSVTGRIVEGLGGELTIVSDVGAGTRVRVTLPSIDETRGPGARKPISDRIHPDARLRILAVDDDPLVTAALRRLLASHDVDAVPSGEDAIEFLGAHADPHLILVDLMLPGINGWELYQYIERVRPTLAERVVFVSGGTGLQESREIEVAMPERLALKPLDGKTLGRLIDEFAYGEDLPPPPSTA